MHAALDLSPALTVEKNLLETVYLLPILERSTPCPTSEKTWNFHLSPHTAHFWYLRHELSLITVMGRLVYSLGSLAS